MIEVLEEIKNRRSGRAFLGKPIPAEALNSILEAGRWAPSCGNTQAWNFMVVEDKRILSEAHEAVSKGNSWGKAARVLLFTE